LLLVAPLSSVRAQETTDQTALLAQIEQLLQQITTLQQQLDKTRAEVRSLIRENLAEGMEGDDVRAIQELLATDVGLYPSGLTTGFFGPLTRQALERFQTRYELVVTGRLDEPTRAALEALREEQLAGRMNPGFLASQAARERVKERLQAKWGECDFAGGFDPSTCARTKKEEVEKTDKKEIIERERKVPVATEALKRPLPTTAAERARQARELAMKRAAEQRAKVLAERSRNKAASPSENDDTNDDEEDEENDEDDDGDEEEDEEGDE